MVGLAPTREPTGEAASGRVRTRRLYDEDFWSWTPEQAAALRRRDLDAVDWENVIEEIETLGRSEEHAWSSYCTNVISHLLKMEHSPRGVGRDHWRKKIVTWRDEMFKLLRHHPGLKAKLDEMLAEAWEDGRRQGIRMLVEHTDPSSRAATKALRWHWEERLPEECPYPLEDIAGYDPKAKRYSSRNKMVLPDGDVWPAPVARRMNEELGDDYPVRFRAPSPVGRSR